MLNPVYHTSKGKGRVVLSHRIAAATSCLLFVIIVLVFAAGAVSAQTTPSPSPSASPAGTVAPPSQPAAPTASGATMSIESTILAYQGFQLGAQAIADALQTQLKSTAPSKVVIATPADVTNILQLRIVLAQAHSIDSHINKLNYILRKVFKCPPVATTSQAPLFPVTGFNLNWLGAWFATPADISGMITAIGSLSAQTESLTPESGALTDSTLMSLVAADLNAGNENATIVVFVPSIGQAHLFEAGADNTGPDLSNTFLGQSIAKLDRDRVLMQEQAANTLNAPGCAAHPNDQHVKDISAIVAAAAATVDAFENAILGTPTVPPPHSGGAAQTQTATPSGKESGPPQNTTTVTTTVSTAPAQAPSPSGPSTPLAQLISADLLLQQINVLSTSKPKFADVYMLAVHALESGGSQLTKQQVFLGTRQYYSGGAVATFQLIGDSGITVCSGVAYGYRGFIQADDVGQGITNKTNVNVPGTKNYLPDAHPGSVSGCAHSSPLPTPSP
jgi:hypothetical protein